MYATEGQIHDFLFVVTLDTSLVPLCVDPAAADPKGYSITSYDAATGTIEVDGTPPSTTTTTKFTVSRERGDSNADGYCADDAVCSNAGDLGAVCSKCTNECRCSLKFTGPVSLILRNHFPPSDHKAL